MAMQKGIFLYLNFSLLTETTGATLEAPLTTAVAQGEADYPRSRRFRAYVCLGSWKKCFISRHTH